jgi:hypothetical protein
VGDLTRRAFLGKTLLTGATIAVGGLSTTSTTPVKTATQATTTFKNLNVLSPKAKAYRGFLKGLIGGAVPGNDPAGVSDLRTSTKTLLTKFREHNPKTGNIEKVKTSYGRSAFETAIKKPEGSWSKMEAKQGVGNPGAQNIAIDMRTDKRSRAGAGGKPPSSAPQTRRLAATLTRGARQYHADELRAFRRANPDRMHKKVSARIHKENMKAKSKGGGMMGGGKFIEGVETPRNPTGMSLLNRKSILM